MPRAVLHRLRLLRQTLPLLLQLLHEEAGEAADERRHGVVLLSALQHGERAQQQLQEERLEEKALVLRLLLQRPVHDARHRLVDRCLLLRHHLERVLREIAQILVHGTVVAEEPILALQHVAERQEQTQAVLNGRHGAAHGVDHIAILAVGVEERLLEAVVATLEGDLLLLQRLHVAARSALVTACLDHERALLHLLPQRAHKTHHLAHLARQQRVLHVTQGARHQTAQTLQAEDRRAVRVQHAVQLLERAGAGALEVAVLQQLHRRAVPLHHGRIQRVHLLHRRVLTLRHIAVQLHGDERQHEEVVQQVGVHQLQRVLLDVVLHQRVDHAARQQQVE